MDGWWCVRFGGALARVEAPSEAAAVRRSLELHPLGDWTDDARRLVACPQDAYPDHSGPDDYTRAVRRAKAAPGRPSRRRGLSSRSPLSMRSSSRTARLTRFRGMARSVDPVRLCGAASPYGGPGADSRGDAHVAPSRF